jgi:cation:H+ antiporter
VSAAIRGNLGVMTGNLLGGIAVQTPVLVFLDLISRSKTPLTPLSKVPRTDHRGAARHHPRVARAARPAAAATGCHRPRQPDLLADRRRVARRADHPEPRAFLGTVKRRRRRGRPAPDRGAGATAQGAPRPNRFEHGSTRKAVIAFSVAAAATLVAGVALERSGDQLATGLGSTASCSAPRSSPP